MDFSQSFSVLNERLRPRVTSSDKLYCSLNRMERRPWYTIRTFPSSYRPTILPANPEPKFSATEGLEDPKELECAAKQADLISDDPREEGCADPQPFDISCLAELSLKDEGDEDEADEESRTSSSEEKDIAGELTSERTGSSTPPAAGEGDGPFQRSYMDGTLPDLIKSGRPLSRRRTLGHVSETLKEVRREVELSRRRSIKLKAQVDKLQESREGPGWSQHRETVTEEVLSILRLLHPLTEPECVLPKPLPGGNQLDAALAQLQNVARNLAFSHTAQSKSGKTAEDNAVLQQALCDRDDAMEKKKAMEAELLRSKTEMMLLNNQLLEAVQKRLEMSLELEAWKEDLQQIIQQQVQSQQQTEQKKSSRLGLLRRQNKAPIQRPSAMSPPTAAAPTVNSNQIFINKSAVSTAPTPGTPPPNINRTWRDRMKKGRTGRQGNQLAVEQASRWGKDENGFQVVCLD
ncbi:bicaudal-D-related protein 2-like [Brachionichthys hirsutus]|uniref:bicaudal-D-related protein 2-like n=1 Tax=Brachionichthys hirsutus TaxID=412623 RepID=UPI003604E13B